MVEGISVPAEDFQQQQEQKPFCEACICSKQHRLPFPDSDSKSADLLELVHMDVCGPMPVTSITKARYLATFIDDHSKLSHVVPLKQKSEVAGAVKATIRMLENQSGKRLKAVRTDNGTEYVNSELEAYFSSKGVLHNTTAPYTPEQNGVAERSNRTLMERVWLEASTQSMEHSPQAGAGEYGLYSIRSGPWALHCSLQRRQSLCSGVC